ncbi:MAG TPA: hypothetical protein PK095_11340 [Myxococcota bacterium]|nr:hypothetical protein [Myxococcota bacterium]
MTTELTAYDGEHFPAADGPSFHSLGRFDHPADYAASFQNELDPARIAPRSRPMRTVARQATSRHPLRAQSVRTPWAGYWWPMSEGELALGWEDGRGRRRLTPDEARHYDQMLVSPTAHGRAVVQALQARQGRELSPLLKFDLWSRALLERLNPTDEVPWPLVSRSARWDLTHHYVSGPGHKHHRAASYAGKCFGWAMSTFDWDEPVHERLIDGVAFTPADIKGLLASLYNGAQFFVPDASFVGNTFRDEPGRDSQAFYDDVRPDDFVRGLFATVGRGLMLEADLDPGPDVWNHPIHRYELTAGPIVHGRVTVRCVIGFADDDVPIDGVFSRVPGRPDLKERVLDFELTLPSESTNLEDAVSGRWLGESVHTHPDTLVLGLEPDWRQEILNYRDTAMRGEFNFSLVKRVRVGREWTSLIDVLLARYYQG